jgi:hypothetical protein
MSLTTGLVARLEADSGVGALAGDRIFPNMIPQEATRPALAYQIISAPRFYTHSGATGEVVARVQITIEGNTYAECEALAEAVEASLSGFRGALGDVTVGAIFLDNEIDAYAETFAEATRRQDYIIRKE